MGKFRIRPAVVIAAFCALTSGLCAPVHAAPSHVHAMAAGPGEAFVPISDSVSPVTDADTGGYRSASMTIDIVLAPRNEAQLSGLLAAVYDPNGMGYMHWLAKDQFDSLFAPERTRATSVAAYLRASGLAIERAPSPFVVRASGSSTAVSAALRTNLRTYRTSKGLTYYSNASAVQLPANVATGVVGVIGLSNTVRPRSQVKLPLNVKTSAKSCEAPYPTKAQLFAAVNDGTSFPFGYGGGPGCNGLTPSQDNAIYGAPDVGPRGKGAGVNLAVFELAAYQHSDIATWVHTFYGHNYTAPLVDINVDGGPLAPACPSGDTCFPGYGGDDEVDADIQMQLAISPDARHILVYNAPNDETGQTELDEYSKIADDDTADVVSSSWAVCENDVSSAYVQAENVVFEKMALQGQSMFGAEGDTGSFGCIRSDGTTIPNLIDPPAQPWVTSVGGTSLESFNPGANEHPSYPSGVETVWNVDNLCNAGPASPGEGGQPGFFWCGATGAGGGGNSEWWGRPFYQFGPGVNNGYTAYGNGTTHCALARTGTPCRETPDISANADEYTPYAEYCTANAGTPGSSCGFSASQTPPGWFGIGGTSLSSPLWSAIFADRDGYQRHRTGNANPLLYLLYTLDAHGYFHDITGIHQSTNNNGLYPTTPGYDLATGIGTPKMSAIITGFPR